MLIARMLRVPAIVFVLGCRQDVMNGWPQGHALLQGSVLRRGAAPYDGQLFAACADAGRTFRTTEPGRYRVELAWSFPAGVPADSISCEVRATEASFSATRLVRFVPLDAPMTAHTLDVIEP